MNRKFLTKKNSTRAERVLAQALVELRIPFEHRVIVSGREIDFIVGEYAIEIDGHQQIAEKNITLANLGYKPVHLSNSQLKDVQSTKLWLQTLQIN